MLQSEGHEVEIFIKEKQYQKMYEGFCKKHTDINSWMREAMKGKYLSVFDSVTSGDIGDYLRKKGVPVVGGQVIADKMELDREFGLQVMADAGISIPETFAFKTISDGLQFLKASPGRYVFKPYGATQGVSAETYVSESEVDIVDFMKKQKDQKFILQKFLKGEELSTEVWFSQGVPLEPVIHDIETKKFMPGDVGCNTGCMSSLEWAGGGFDSKACQEGIGKCFDYLASIKYSGSLDLNSIITEDGKLHGLEWTCRMGYSAEYAEFRLFKEPLGLFFQRIAKGTAMPINMENKYGFALRVSIPPYPLEGKKDTDQYVTPLMRKSANNEVKVKKLPGVEYHYLDVYTKDGKYFTAGNDAIVLEITCTADTVEEGKKLIYEAAKEVQVGDKQYRVDGYERAIKQIPTLNSMGYARRG
jgi:phosphoribosylamine-glycine ligase